MKTNIPVWEKAVLSIPEATEYSGIGRGRLRKLCDDSDCPFSFKVGNRRMIKRKEFDQFISTTKAIS